jgi:hypothetical protein
MMKGQGVGNVVSMTNSASSQHPRSLAERTENKLDRYTVYLF